MTLGHKVIVDAVFRDMGLDVFLDGLKRDQGNSVAAETVALVANSVEMTGISVNRLDRMIEKDIVREEYGLESNTARSIYRTVDRLGGNSDRIVAFLGETMKRKYGLRMQTVFMDWTSLFFEAPQQGIVRVGYSRDHRPDRPQVTIGLSMDRDSGMPVGLTVNAGNILDVSHFEDTFEQIRPLLPEDALIVFDNGAYSRKNSALLDEAGIGFVTRQQLNASDDKFAKAHADDWIRIDDDISYQLIKGNRGRKRYLFRSDVRRAYVLNSYRSKAERDYDEMEFISKGIDAGKKPRKKYRNSNCFISTHLSYQFPLKVFSREEAIDKAVTSMISGREGLFVLSTNRELSAWKVLELYRARGQVETAFRDLKHGIDRRPARCTSEMAIKGRILISFLALFCMSMVRFLYPQYRNLTAESLCEELGSFSLTVLVRKGEPKRRIFSNFGPLIRLIRGDNRPEWVPKAPDQATIDRFSV
ncbi:MAG: IS1634 family transposase [archaeon]|nr:IS1634 family transposase [archaeon]